MDTNDQRIVALMKKIVTWLVDEDFDAIAEYSCGIRLSAQLMRKAIIDYGRTLVMPPESSFSAIDVVRIEKTDQPTWSIYFDLWTKEEGRSDLTLECTMIDRGGQRLDVEIDNLHTL